MKKLLLLFLLIGGHAISQETGDVVFCWNVERQVLEIQDVTYISDSNLLDPNGTNDDFPVVTAITSTATSTTVSGTITFMITATDDVGISRYEFIASTNYEANADGEYQSISTSGESNIATLQFSETGIWRTYFYITDTSGQTTSASGPTITVN